MNPMHMELPAYEMQMPVFRIPHCEKSEAFFTRKFANYGA